MSTSSSKRKKIWIDTDIIFNKPGEEIDDGLALMMAFNNDDVDIVGISLIHAVDNGYDVTKKLLQYYGDDSIPVYKGTDDATKSFGHKTEAVEQLDKSLMKDELTVIAIGPATNIANLLEFYPEAAANINEIVFCAGRNQGVSFLPENSNRGLPDYNFDLDPESFRKVLESDLHVTFSGYEGSSTIYLYEDDIKKIKNNGRDGDEWVYQMLLPWLERWKQGLQVKGFIPFHCCTIGHVLYPDYLSYNRNIPVQINLRKNDCGTIIEADEKPFLEVSYDFDSPHKVDFVYKTDPSYKQVVMNELLGK